MVDDDDGEGGSFKRPGAVPFNWEIRPGIPKTRDDDVPPTTLLQPPKKLSHLRLKQLPPPSSSSPPSSSPKPRAVSPFAPPPPYFKAKTPSASSGPPSPYWRSSSARVSGGSSALPRWRLLKSLIGGMKKSNKSRDVMKKTGDEDSTSSESGEFYESGTTFTPSEGGSSRGSVGTSWSSSSSSSSLKRNESDLSLSERKERKVMLMMARAHNLG